MMNKITNQIKLIGGMLSFMIAAIVFITVYINQTSKQDSVVINVAGKQRMLTQKITKEVLGLQTSKKPDFTVLDVSIKEFDTTLDDLITGNDERNIYAPPKACMKERLLQVQSLWSSFNGYLQDYKSLLIQSNALKGKLAVQNGTILHASDAVVKQMVADGLGGKVIDDAGRQRMLTQKIALHATHYLITGELKHFSNFYESYGLYEMTLQGFLNDAKLQRLESLQSLLQENREAWKAYSGYIINLMEIQKLINETITYVKDINIVLLETMDSAVESYAVHSENQREFLQYFQYAASLIAFLFMLISAKLTWKIEKHFSAFLERSEAMAVSMGDESGYDHGHAARHDDELTVASMHMSQFVNKMNTVIEHAQQAIHESEQAAKELAGVTESIDDELDELDLDEASKKDIDKTIDKSEDIVIQTLEELSGTSKLLSQLQNNLNTILSKTENRK
jgi:methyl-accepting chemotaxis protein